MVSSSRALLLPSQVAVHGLGVFAKAHSLQKPQALQGYRIHRPQQGRFLVDTLAEVGDEGTSQAYGHLKGADSGP